jgi:hypothetical protein
MEKRLKTIWIIMMFVILSTTFLMINPDSKLALMYRNIRNSTDGMIIPKMIILLIVIISVIIALKKNLTKWAIEFRDHTTVTILVFFQTRNLLSKQKQRILNTFQTFSTNSSKIQQNFLVVLNS